jgi:uncharacterized membrane protein YhhN
MYVSFAFFVAASAAHIVFISLGKEKPRRISKVLIIPSLIVFYIVSAHSPYAFTVMALVFGWIGDIALISKRRRINFKIGLLAFMVGHICYIFTFINLLKDGEGFRFNTAAAFIYVPLALFFIAVLLRVIIRPNCEMSLPIIIYIIVIEIMGFWAFELFACGPGTGEALIFAGSLYFMISDALLGHYTFKKLTRMGAVLIMLFYVIAQAGIITGLVVL